jgi:hypothetical protein
MGSSGSQRRFWAEIRFGAERGAIAVLGNRCVYEYWHFLEPYYGQLLLAPQWRAAEGRATWTWQEPSGEAGIPASKLAEFRRRLAAANAALPERIQAEATQADPASAAAGIRDLVLTRAIAIANSLIDRGDDSLAEFVCHTESGYRIHSWGAAAPAKPFSLEKPRQDIRGRVAIEGGPRSGAVVLEDWRGASLERVVPEEDGSFIFTGMEPGLYKVRGEYDGVAFTPPEATVNVTAEKGGEVVLQGSVRRGAEPAAVEEEGGKEAAPPAGKGKRRTAAPVLIFLILLLLLGGGLVWLRSYSSTAGGARSGGQLEPWVSAARGPARPPADAGDGHAPGAGAPAAQSGPAAAGGKNGPAQGQKPAAQSGSPSPAGSNPSSSAPEAVETSQAEAASSAQAPAEAGAAQTAASMTTAPTDGEAAAHSATGDASAQTDVSPADGQTGGTMPQEAGGESRSAGGTSAASSAGAGPDARPQPGGGHGGQAIGGSPQTAAASGGDGQDFAGGGLPSAGQGPAPTGAGFSEAEGRAAEDASAGSASDATPPSGERGGSFSPSAAGASGAQSDIPPGAPAPAEGAGFADRGDDANETAPEAAEAAFSPGGESPAFRRGTAGLPYDNFKYGNPGGHPPSAKDVSPGMFAAGPEPAAPGWGGGSREGGAFPGIERLSGPFGGADSAAFLFSGNRPGSGGMDGLFGPSGRATDRFVVADRSARPVFSPGGAGFRAGFAPHEPSFSRAEGNAGAAIWSAPARASLILARIEADPVGRIVLREERRSGSSLEPGEIDRVYRPNGWVLLPNPL